MQANGNAVLGIVGGMGPLASVEFLKTIYEHHLGRPEQQAPVIMYSDPTFPDRTEELLHHSPDKLLSKLSGALDQLIHLGAANIVICCVTIHHLLPELDRYHRKRIVSLLDVIFDSIGQRGEKHLLICTNGSRRLRVFETHSKWNQFQDLIVLPDTQDQDKIHNRLIYGLKKDADALSALSLVESLMQKYGVRSCIAGCTEIHLLAKDLVNVRTGYGCIDPLTVFARQLTRNEL